MQVKYIGLDAHSSTCTFCVLDSNGREIDNRVIVTNGRLLIDYLKTQGKNVILAFEECDLSGWLVEILSKHTKKVLVCNPLANTPYKRAKTDKLDARNIAQLLRGGFLKPVFHDGSEREKFRLLISGYNDTVQESVRIQNRLNSLKRRARLAGSDASKHIEFMTDQLQNQSDRLYTSREEYQKIIQSASKNFKESRHLESIPGIGPIQSARIIAQVVDPHRFDSKYKFFAYCGLVKHPRTSGGRSYGKTRIWGNRTLKAVFKMAAHSALRGKNALKDYYEFLRQEKGISDQDARNAVARKIATLALALWKHGQYFDAQRILKKDLPVEA